jgi:hypothetical protein
MLEILRLSMHCSGAVPVSKMFGTFALSVGVAVRGGPWQLSSISNFFFPFLTRN